MSMHDENEDAPVQKLGVLVDQETMAEIERLKETLIGIAGRVHAALAIEKLENKRLREELEATKEVAETIIGDNQHAIRELIRVMKIDFEQRAPNEIRPTIRSAIAAVAIEDQP